MAAPVKTLLRTQGLVKTFPNAWDPAHPVRALDGVTLELSAEDRLIALVGPDGAGKSTFLRTLCGLEVPDSGTVELLGQTPDPDDEAFIGSIAFMPQSLGLYRTLSCRENLEVFAGLRGVAGADVPERIAKLLKMTGLAGFEERPAGKLSGGMKQKLALASALLRVPRVLILDEPTVGVDPLSRRELWAVVREMLAESDMICLFSTAYLEEAQAADRVLLFEDGRLAANDAPENLMAAARGLVYQKPLVGMDERGAEMLCRRLMRGTALDRPGSMLLDAVPRAGGAALTLLPGAAPEALALPGIEPRKATLEDAYVLLTFPPSVKTEKKVTEGTPEEAPTPEKPSAPAPEPPEQTGAAERRDVVIRASGISRRFGGFVAVADTSFTVTRGEIFGLLGPNGAGKTTTFRMLCGLLAPSAGEIEVAGSDLRTAKAAARARIGYVAQKFSLYGRLTVEQNLRYFGRSYGLYGRGLERRIEETAEDFGLARRMKTAAAALPFGARRDLSMACGLIHHPDILFLDEATSGADLASRRAFWRRIADLADAGTTVVVTTHFLEEAEYCDRFLIQDAGKVLVLGTPREVKAAGAAASGGAFRAEEASIEDAFIAIVEKARREGASS